MQRRSFLTLILSVLAGLGMGIFNARSIPAAQTPRGPAPEPGVWKHVKGNPIFRNNLGQYGACRVYYTTPEEDGMAFFDGMQWDDAQLRDMIERHNRTWGERWTINRIERS